MKKTYTPEQLKAILADHKLWLESYGDKGTRAILDGASLDGASLVGASLNRASLNRASLVGASLVGASLDGASLVGASLNRASLVGASLDGASLDGASLDGASLNRASLDGASLDGASLFLARVNYTAGPLLVIGRQGEYSRDAILNTELKTVQIGCFCGSFDAAREAIREKYGDKADAVTGGYGLTLLAMDAIEQEGEKRKESESAE